jgi:HEPN domain-containing protein
MTQDEAVQRWRKSAEENLQVARDLMKLKHYDWALFMGQLALEKLLKGLVIKVTDDAPPYIHDLVKLAIAARLSLDNEKREDFSQVSKFNIRARYEEDKYELYKKATPEFTRGWMQKIEEYGLWIQKHY